MARTKRRHPQTKTHPASFAGRTLCARALPCLILVSLFLIILPL